MFIVLQFDEFCEKFKTDLRGEIEVYPDKKEKEKWEDYQKAMIEHLDKKMKDFMQQFEEEMRKFATDKLKPLQGMAHLQCT